MSKHVRDEITRWTKEVKRGAVTLAIMALLSRSRAYGYELVKSLGEKAPFLALEQGTVYPLLRRMEKRDLLSAEWDYEDPAKPKKYYALTDDGRAALSEMRRIWSEMTDGMAVIIEGVSL
ncbi:MAG: PadR family transcriptional regulator [Candidatus Thorarchaeota archaeon]